MNTLGREDDKPSPWLEYLSLAITISVIAMVIVNEFWGNEVSKQTFVYSLAILVLVKLLFRK